MDQKEIERSFQASIHGVKYNPSLSEDSDRVETPMLSKENESLAQRHMEQRIAEMKRKAQGKNG